MSRNLLDDVFETPEEGVESFMEALEEALEKPTTVEEKSNWSKIRKGESDQGVAPVLVDQTSGLIQIMHGWHANHYVWHIRPAHVKRPWKVSISRVIYAIAKVMNAGIIKPTTNVNIFPPFKDWDIPEITFKALELKDDWAIDKKEIDKMNMKLFEVLNSLV